MKLKHRLFTNLPDFGIFGVSILKEYANNPTRFPLNDHYSQNYELLIINNVELVVESATRRGSGRSWGLPWDLRRCLRRSPYACRRPWHPLPGAEPAARQWPREVQHQAVQDGSRGDGGAPDSGEVPQPARTCAAPRGRQERRAGRQAGGVGYVLVEGQQLGVMVMGWDPGSWKEMRWYHIQFVTFYISCNVIPLYRWNDAIRRFDI